MRNLFDRVKKLTATEILLLGTAFMLILLIAMRWESIWKDIQRSFSRLFQH